MSRTKTLFLALALVLVTGAIAGGSALSATAGPGTKVPAKVKPKPNPNVINPTKAKTAILNHVQALAQNADDNEGLYVSHYHLVKCTTTSTTQVACTFSVAGTESADAYTGLSSNVICKGHAQANLVNQKIKVTILDWQYNNNSCSIVSTGPGVDD